MTGHKKVAWTLAVLEAVPVYPEEMNAREIGALIGISGPDAKRVLFSLDAEAPIQESDDHLWSYIGQRQKIEYLGGIK